MNNMAQNTIIINATASLSANGRNTATGSIAWEVPSLPVGVDSWDSIVISGMWVWNSKGSISIVTINGTNTSNGVAFSISLDSNVISPLTITCVGNNNNARGSYFSWANLVITYTYTEPENIYEEILKLKENNSWTDVQAVYKKESGIWIKQDDLSNLFDTNIKYIKK